MLVPIVKNGTEVSQLPVYDKLTVNRELMGPDEIPAEIELPGTLLAPIGSVIQHRGKPYTVNTIPNVQKVSNYLYKYGLLFESAQYRLYDKKLKHITAKNKTFQYYGAPADYAQLIVDNINQIDSGWSVGDCDVLPEKAITFTGATCRTALDIVAESFELEWSVNGKVISFVKQVGSLTSLVFKYGRGQGLYSLSYQYQNDKNIVTRATGYGSSRNLPENYRDGATQLMFDGEYLEKNVFALDGVTTLYGVKEGDYENQDIYPEIAGLVSAVSAFDPDANTFTITDSTLDFNLNDYFSSETPKIAFKSGELQGQEFEIIKYDHGTKTITAKVFVDESDNKLPSAVFQPAIGDTYTLFDMHLPDEVVQDAEDRLQAATQTWLNENCVPRVLYSLDIDPIYARDNGVYLNPGDKIRVIDEDLGIDELIRVVKTSYPFEFPDRLPVDMQIVCEIANFIPYTLAERVIAGTIDNKTEIKIVNRTNAEKARLNTLRLNNLATRIFDPDGNLAKGDETLYAGMAKLGFDSQNFDLNDVSFLSNAGSDPNALTITAGHLVHRFYEIEGLGYDWSIPARSWSGLDALKFYYVYAKCSKTVLTGTWELSETPISVNDVPGFWVFNVGQLAEVNAKGYRPTVDFTKGVTYIVGGRIITGDIQSGDGTTGFNLDTATIYGNITFIASDGSTKNVAEVDDAIIAANEYIDAVLPGQLQDLQDQIDGTIESFFQQVDPTPGNYPAVDWTTPELKQQHSNDTYTNTDTGASWRWVFESGNWIWKVITDTATQQALALAGEALDTADGKRRVFLVTPFTPYDAGDLWTDGTDIFKCDVTRLTGSYNAADWSPASIYDSTQVTIDNGIVTAGTMQLGNTGGINAGITGNGTLGTEVRFWAGASFADRAIAPFRVLQNGTMYATEAFISGEIEASSGNISGFSIDANGLVNESIYKLGSLISGSGNARVIMSKKYLDGSDIQIGNKDVAFGNFAIPGYGESQNSAGFIENGEPDKPVNTALILSAYGASVKNVALRIEGGDIVVGSFTGIDITLDVRVGGGHFWQMRWVKGILVSAIDMGE